MPHTPLLSPSPPQRRTHAHLPSAACTPPPLRCTPPPPPQCLLLCQHLPGLISLRRSPPQAISPHRRRQRQAGGRGGAGGGWDHAVFARSSLPPAPIHAPLSPRCCCRVVAPCRSMDGRWWPCEHLGWAKTYPVMGYSDPIRIGPSIGFI
jgi:hypothetical protein